MQDSLAGQLLATFSTKERKLFRYFLLRPERANQGQLAALSGLLFKKKVASMEAAFQKFYPDETFSAQRINQLLSLLHREGNAFLLERHYAQAGNELPLLEILDRRKVFRHRDKLRRKLNKQVVSLQEGRALREAELPLLRVHKSSAGKSILAYDLLLDESFAQQKLWHACGVYSYFKTQPTEHDTGLLQAVLDFVEEKGLIERPEFGLFYLALKMTSEDSAKHYQEFELLFNHAPEWLPKDQIRDLHLLAITFCIRMTNLGKGEVYKPEALKWYRKGFKEGALVKNGRVSQSTLLNAIRIGMAEGYTDWSRATLEEYTSFIDPDERDFAVGVCRARIAFHTKLYDSALEALRYVNSKEVIQHLILTTLKAQIYYEMNANDLLINHLDTTMAYIRRKSTSYHKSISMSFCRYLKKIISLDNDKQSRRSLREALIDEESVIEKEWLLDKITSQR